MPIVDPERLPEVAQAVDLDLSRERPTVDEVNFYVSTPMTGVKAIFTNGSAVAGAFSFLMVGVGAASVGYVIKFIASPLIAVLATIVVFASGLVFVDRWRRK